MAAIDTCHGGGKDSYRGFIQLGSQGYIIQPMTSSEQMGKDYNGYVPHSLQRLNLRNLDLKVRT